MPDVLDKLVPDEYKPDLPGEKQGMVTGTWSLIADAGMQT